MTEMDMEMVCFQIISAVGSARSTYIDAIKTAKKGDIQKAKEMIEEGDTIYNSGHDVHQNLIASEVEGVPVAVSLFLVHAEDQLMSAESFRTIAVEFIDLYEQLAHK